MRIGVICGVHANLPALEAVLEHLRAASVDTVVCAGDVVGRGPHPDACVEVLAEHRIPCVAGVYDRMAVGGLSLDGCDPLTRRSQYWTRSVMSPATAAYLAALPATYTLGPVVVRHADTPGDGPTRGPEVVPDILVLGGARRPRLSSDLDRGIRPSRRREVALPPGRLQVGPGRAGWSIDRLPRAHCAVLDLAAGRVVFPAVAYDSDRTFRDLARIGVPGTAVHDPPLPARVLRRRVDPRGTVEPERSAR